MIRALPRGLITMPTLTAQAPAIRKPRLSRSRWVAPTATTPYGVSVAATHSFVTPVVREIRRTVGERASTAALW
jgi:hypothetical protein